MDSTNRSGGARGTSGLADGLAPPWLEWALLVAALVLFV
jgi:hypothetical protein